jgi:hypothetical protein
LRRVILLERRSEKGEGGEERGEERREKREEVEEERREKKREDRESIYMELQHREQ